MRNATYAHTLKYTLSNVAVKITVIDFKSNDNF
jgi:hypothetical protein